VLSIDDDTMRRPSGLKLAVRKMKPERARIAGSPRPSAG